MSLFNLQTCNCSTMLNNAYGIVVLAEVLLEMAGIDKAAEI